MIDILKKYLFSSRLMAVLFFVFAFAMAMGTFIESWYSTETARIWVYNTTWFEAIMLFFVINFIGSIKKYRLFRLVKWPILMLHLSWVFIIIGAFVTRYISYEGIMPIREGKTEKRFFSDKTYLRVLVDGDLNGAKMRKELEDDLLVTPEAIRSSLPWKSDFSKIPFTISYVDFIQGAEESLVPDENGESYLKLVEASGGNRHEHFLKSGEVSSIHNILFALNIETPGAINIKTTDSIYTIFSPFDGDYMRMADQFKGNLSKDSLQPLVLRSLYNVAEMQFVLPDSIAKGSYGIVPLSKDKITPNSEDAIVLNVSANGKQKQVKLLGGKGRTNPLKEFTLGGLDFKMGFGAKIYELPFGIKLNDFIADKYPGTEKSYKAFKSKVTIEDERPFDYEIFMNHVLDHKGFRFFQAGFDPDEKGSNLSVSHDFWGKWITYIGYFLLYTGLIGTLFFGKTRFRELKNNLIRVKTKKAKLLGIFFFFLSLGAVAQDKHAHENRLPNQQEIDSVIKTVTINKEHADKFSTLVVQDEGGRMKPVHTLASELLRKISKSNKFKNLDANQVLLAMMLNPPLWYNVELVHLDWKNDSIRKLIEMPKEQEMAKTIQFFTDKGAYKLAPYLQEAYATNTPNSFQKDFKKIDQKIALLNSALGGQLLKFFPLLNNENNKWVSAVDYRSGEFPVKDTLYGNFIKNSIPFYLMTLRNAKKTGDYTEADKLVEALKQNQQNYGKEVLPSEEKIKAEIIYNKADIFQKLYQYYGLFGLLMFLFLVFQIFKDRKFYRGVIKTLKVIIIALFVLHTLGLIFRWYISGHAPWSNAYESIIYVAWATMAIGLLFGRKSDMTMASTTFVSCMLLWIAHQNWIDPEIGTLVPVLDSYWLMIHVAVIVGSYGPFTLGMILGVVSLILIILTNKENKARMDLNIKEITIINEMALTVGLVMLTIGNFLGGMWANESWGRYWGWDPKETWALVSIMVYAFVIHMRYVPGLRGKWFYNFISVIAFASIMMTYFGVNFYLSGLHSYASGEQIITPVFIWYTVAIVFTLGGVSYWRYRIHYKK